MEKFHLTAIIDTIRHGEKDTTGELTLQGHVQAALRGVDLRDMQGSVHMSHSGASRVLQTIRMAKELLSRTIADTQHQSFGTDVQKCIDNCALPSKVQAVVRSELHFLLDPTQKSTYFSTWTKAPTKEEAAKRAQAFLSLGSTSPEPDVLPSPRTMAQRVASLLLEQIRASMTTPYHHRENFLNGTHEPVILAFVGYMFSNFQVPAPDFIPSIGGAIDFTEGFSIHVYQSEDNKFLLQCVFRNLMTTFTLEELDAFALA